MEEFTIDCESYGLGKIIKDHPSVCEPLFVNGEMKNAFRVMVPNYSDAGSARKCRDGKIRDFLHDTSIAFADENIPEHSYAVA